MMHRSQLRQVLVVVAVVSTIIVNALANILPINGLNTGELSDRFQVFFVPAGYVFSIWGLIYLGLIAYAVYQALPGQRDNPRLAAIAYPFIISSLANMVWIFLWHYERFPLTLVAMAALLASLIWIYLRLGIGRAAVSRTEQWLVRIPFSIYLGWVTVATVANVTAVLDYWQWDGGAIGAQLWAVLLLLVASAIATAVSFTRGDIPYVLVLVWAFAGISVKHAGTALVAPTAWGLTGLLLLVMVAGALWHGRRQRLHAAPS